MRGLKINKQVGRDYPLSNTPEPIGMQQEREKQTIDSIKGSSLRLMQEKKAKDKADSALKSAKEKRESEAMNRAMDALRKNPQM